MCTRCAHWVEGSRCPWSPHHEAWTLFFPLKRWAPDKTVNHSSGWEASDGSKERRAPRHGLLTEGPAGSGVEWSGCPGSETQVASEVSAFGAGPLSTALKGPVVRLAYAPLWPRHGEEGPCLGRGQGHPPVQWSRKAS